MAKQRGKHSTRQSGPSPKRAIKQYEHADKLRANIPPVGLVTPETDPDPIEPIRARKTYAYDPHLDPQLTWAGKAERTSFEIPTVSLHVHERIDPKTIIEAVRAKNGNGGTGVSPVQMPLFSSPAENPPLRDAIEFYKHLRGWSNRLIAGDSLLVMNSLLEKEGLGGGVQMIYIDPPYGIRYGSNFQPFTHKRDVKDGADDDLTLEPETLKAFRDTWELGIHSYLTYLRDRLLLAKELLHESGSCFVQISDENIHHVRELMDEVFSPQNFVSVITFRKTSGAGSFAGGTNVLPSTNDYLVWYARSIDRIKYRQLYFTKELGGAGGGAYTWIEDTNGNRRRANARELEDVPQGARVFRADNLTSQTTRVGQTTVFPVEVSEKTYRPNKGGWKTNQAGMAKLKLARRLIGLGETLSYVRYFGDFPAFSIANFWEDTTVAGFAEPKRYVVETSVKVIARCLLMTTDPGDLVLDPTCGSGTTAYVAEQWGRRWITTDTSRVALTLAKQRLMTAVFDFYRIKWPPEAGIASGSGAAGDSPAHGTTLRRTEQLSGAAGDAPAHGTTLRRTEQLSGAAGDSPAHGTTLRRTEQLSGAAGEPPAQRESVREPAGITGGGGGRGVGGGGVSPSNGFIYKTVPHVTLKSIANNPEITPGMSREQIDKAIAKYADTETLYDQPEVDRSKARVTGPFTVEAVPAISGGAAFGTPEVKRIEPIEWEDQRTLPGVDDDERLQPDASIAREGETLRQSQWRAELFKTGIRAKGGAKIEFTRIEALPVMRYLQAEGETKPPTLEDKPQRVVVSFGPEFAPLEQRQVERAIEEARSLVPKVSMVIFAALQFDPEASKDIDETKWPGVTLLKVQMNGDLVTDDLKKKRSSNESFWLIGQPDVAIRKALGSASRLNVVSRESKTSASAAAFIVEVHGFDYYNPKSGKVESGGKHNIAMWMLDSDYDGRSVYPRQVFFPMSGPKDGWSRLAKNLRAEIDPELIEHYRGTVSLPFAPGSHQRVAVKIVDDRGIESLRILDLDDDNNNNNDNNV